MALWVNTYTHTENPQHYIKSGFTDLLMTGAQNGNNSTSSSGVSKCLSFFFFFRFDLDDVYIAERDACLCGPPTRVGKVKESEHHALASSLKENSTQS